MEDDEEIQSHPSPPADETEEEAEAEKEEDDDDDDHGSPVPSSSSPQPNGRITVTVASPAPPHPPTSTAASPLSTTGAAGVVTPHHNSLALALPIQTPPPPPPSSSGKTNASGGGREDCWSEGATAVLIDAWGERFVELSRGNLKQKHWQEVAEIVSAREGYSKPAKTDVQCKNRIDTVKKKYKSEKAKISSSSSSSSKWRFFDRLDMLIGPSAPAATKIPPHSSSAAPTKVPPHSSAGYQRVPVGIPVGRPIHGHGYHQLQQQQQANSPFSSSPHNYGQRLKRPAGSESPDSADSLPPGVFGGRKRPRADQLGSQTHTTRVVGSRGWAQPEEKGGGGGGGAGAGEGEGGGEVVAVKKCNRREKAGWGRSLRELTKAIVRFGEAYEQAEGVKLQQMVEMEKQRMKFAKELELQRMKFLMKTQMELSQLTQRPASAAAAAAAAAAGVANHRTHTATTPLHRNVQDNIDNNNNAINNVNNIINSHSDSSN